MSARPTAASAGCHRVATRLDAPMTLLRCRPTTLSWRDLLNQFPPPFSHEQACFLRRQVQAVTDADVRQINAVQAFGEFANQPNAEDQRLSHRRQEGSRLGISDCSSTLSHAYLLATILKSSRFA